MVGRFILNETCLLSYKASKCSRIIDFQPWILSRVGNFIIGASGSDKQMLCESSVAGAAPTVSAVNKIKIGYVCHLSYNLFLWCGILNK